jgi:hypothetical protein
MSNYPTLRLGVLQGIAELKAACDAEPGFLRKPTALTTTTRSKLLEQLFKPVEVEVIKEVMVEKPVRARSAGRARSELERGRGVRARAEAKEMLKELRGLEERSRARRSSSTPPPSCRSSRPAPRSWRSWSRSASASPARARSRVQQTVMGILDDLVPRRSATR